MGRDGAKPGSGSEAQRQRDPETKRREEGRPRGSEEGSDTEAGPEAETRRRSPAAGRGDGEETGQRGRRGA